MRKTTKASAKPAITVLRRLEKKAAIFRVPPRTNCYESKLNHLEPWLHQKRYLKGKLLGAHAMEPGYNHHPRHHGCGEERGDDAQAQGDGEAAHRPRAHRVENCRGQNVGHVGIDDRRRGAAEARID